MILRGDRKSIPAAVSAAKKKAVERFLAAPGATSRRLLYRIDSHPRHNVTGVGIGAKIIKSRKTDRASVRFYVARKLPDKLVPKASRLPREIDGIETDVVELGRLHAQPLSTRLRHRPAKPGCSIGFATDDSQATLLMAGTFGAVVSRNGSKFILSNNHVLACENELPIGGLICQPALLDHGNPSRDAIAKLSAFIPLSAAQQNSVDCAIAEILDPNSIRTPLMAKVGKLASAEPIPAGEGMTVKKIGRGSGYTVGEVFDVSATLTLDYELGTLAFVDQLLIRGTDGPFSDNGDSGALIVDIESKRAVGLLIGGSNDYTVANHIQDVLNALQVTLLT
jgi:hypothetical protein